MTEKVREIVLPGEVIGNTKTEKSGHGTFIRDQNIISKFLGIPKRVKDYISVIPLSGVYTPKRHDKIIGIVISVEKSGWIIDINSPWKGFLSLSEGVRDFIDIRKVSLKRFFDVGDIIYTEIVDVRNGDIQLSMKSPSSRKLEDGVLVKITPSKVPRVIGKEGSMINSIKEKTKTIIRVGQNGVIWLTGQDIEKAIDAIKMIDEKSHIFGLTDKINIFLSDLNDENR